MSAVPPESDALRRRGFLLLFAISGFSGLIYQSIWTHYLKLFLGHAAFSQALVLVIFMGGLALGSWIASRFSARLARPLLAYAAAEALVGVGALVFHRLFVALTGWSEEVVFPWLGGGLALGAWKWGLAALLILPQSILLGATFPLMSAGLARRSPGRGGHTIAALYFANSLGAAAGVLCSGFVLIARVGLPGTILTAGLLNVALAIGVYVIVRSGRVNEADHAPIAHAHPPSPLARRLLFVALLTGTASFVYEIAWLRMLSLVLGASTHAFELMLSAFITGLAIGGFWIRRHVDGLADPERVLGRVQIAMGLLAIGTLAGYGLCFEAMQFLLQALQRSAGGYVVFNLASHALALAVMLPATICAGMTLPIITHMLMTRGEGEAAIGRVYAVNTGGAILGVAIAMLWLMPAIGLAWLLTVGGLVDIVLGLWLLAWRRPARREAWGAAAGAFAIVAGVHATLDWDLERMASGVFLRGELARGDEQVLFHRDGRTATVDVVGTPESLSIRTNGKPDAGLMRQPAATTNDEFTMTLLAALPLMCHSQARSVAVIGLGSGMTTHTLLASPGIARVDTMEIEPAIIEGARLLGPKVARAFEDPRSRIHVADARSFLASAAAGYDLIISEPSNPWVSGVAGLFSVEFYRIARRQLAHGGYFAQWIHVYQLDAPLVASIGRALGEVFPHYVMHATSNGDVLLIAGTDDVPVARFDTVAHTPLAAALARVGIRGQADVDWTRVATDEALEPLFASWDVPANSDFFPVLDQGAVRARFLERDAFDLQLLGAGALYGLLPGLDWPAQGVSADHPLAIARNAATAERMRQYRDLLSPQAAAALAPEARLPIELGRLLQGETARCDPGTISAIAPGIIGAIAAGPAAYAPPAVLAPVWKDLLTGRCAELLAPAERAWLSLLVAAGEEDWRVVEALALALLPPRGTLEATPASRMLLRLLFQAQLHRGGGADALAAWQRFPQDATEALPLHALAALARP